MSDDWALLVSRDALREKHPDWTSEQVQTEMERRVVEAVTARVRRNKKGRKE